MLDGEEGTIGHNKGMSSSVPTTPVAPTSLDLASGLPSSSTGEFCWLICAKYSQNIKYIFLSRVRNI